MSIGDRQFILQMSNELFTHLASAAGDNTTTVNAEICQRLKDSIIKDFEAANPPVTIDGATGDCNTLDIGWIPQIGMLVTYKHDAEETNNLVYVIRDFHGAVDRPVALINCPNTGEEVYRSLDKLKPFRSN